MFDPYRDPSGRALAALLLLALAVAVATGGAFAADPSDAAPSPVAYDDVVELGLSSETDALMAGNATLPRVQVFYSQLQYVVGYNGVAPFASSLADDRTERQFGYPIAAYVETFDSSRPGVTDEGLFAAGLAGEWTPASEAVYVVGSDARSPAGEIVVPFRDPDAAAAFADDHGGAVIGWETLRSRSFDTDTAAVVRETAPRRWAEADRRLAAAARRSDRPVSVVVGEDAPTIQAAVDDAPADTTVVVPPGTYEETPVIDKPVTVSGGGTGDDGETRRGATRLRGDGNGSVLTVRAPNVSVSGLRISGTGTQTRDPDAASRPPEPGEAWDTNIRLGYAHGDAGVKAIGAPGLFVDDVTVDTEASGLLLRGGSDAVVRGLRVDGTEEWQDGFMGIVGMQSRVTVTDSAFVGGRDGVYLHRADGSVVRNSSFAGNRYGTHLMYTGDALIADNAFRNETFGGITVMTRPAGNAIVGNDVRGSGAGIQASGTRTYVGYNTLAGNDLGFSTSARGSLYEHNVAANNGLGARATTVVPSSRVVANDFVGNDLHADAGAGALRVWADGDRGNYWEGAGVSAELGLAAPGERAYRPTAPVDAALAREPAAILASESPAATLLDRLRGTVPGTRSGSIIDPAPSPAPHAPERVAAATDPDGEPVHGRWRGRSDDATAGPDDATAEPDNATAEVAA